MSIYELTSIISSQISSEQADSISQAMQDFIRNQGGVIIASERTAPKILSYPVKKQSSGFYVTVEFQIESDKVKSIEENALKNPQVLRTKIILKKPKFAKEKRRTSLIFQKSLVNQRINEKQLEKTGIEDIEKKIEEILNE